MRALPSSHIKGNRLVQSLVFHDPFLLSSSVQLPFFRFKDPFFHFEKGIESPKSIKAVELDLDTSSLYSSGIHG